MRRSNKWGATAFCLLAFCAVPPAKAKLERLAYNNPGLVVDLGVGLWAWPLPMDYDGDGDYDLVVSCPDVPYNGTYIFENPGGDARMPVFKPAVKVGPGTSNVQVSYIDGKARILKPGVELMDFRDSGFRKTVKVYLKDNVHDGQGRVRANQWKYCDFEGDGDLDLIVGLGDWADYGWDNAFDAQGRWQRGPLHGYVYLILNNGTAAKPQYAEPQKIQAGGNPIDVYGMPSPNPADFDGDGDLDILCGEFLDGFTYFQNTGTRQSPQYAEGRRVTNAEGPIRMDLEMILPVTLDWDKDGDVDLVVGQEDGRVAFIEHTGKIVDGMPQFIGPRFFRQQAADVKFGALVTPHSVDWDDDGDEDLICGNTAGYVGVIENLDGGNPPRWAAPVYLQAEGEAIRIQAGTNGSIQGPCEAKWGYTTLTVADWDHDGLRDILVNSIWGKVVWFRNTGTKGRPKLAAAEPVQVQWESAPPKPAWNWWDPEGNNLATQWRTTPVVIDLNEDGLNDLVMLDHEGYLAWFQRAKRNGDLVLLPPLRVFEDSKGPLRLNAGTAGKSGRRKLCFVDWDQDGQLDLLVNSQSVNFLRCISAEKNRWIFQDEGPVDPQRLAGHTTSPTIVDWDTNGVPDLLIGAEDGYFYYLKNKKD